MARKHRLVQPSGRTVLLTDDDPDYLEATRLLLESEGHTVLCAESGPRALRILRESRVDLLLLDFFMPGMTGDEVVTRLRHFDPDVQVVLQTGYSDEQPPREMLKKLDIQGYYDKSEGPEKLLLWTEAGLKSADILRRVRLSRVGLQYILRVTPELHRIQPVDDLLQQLVTHAAGLLRALEPPRVPSDDDSPPGSSGNPDAFLAMLREDAELTIRASTGRFAGATSPRKVLDPAAATSLVEALYGGEVRATETATIVPLRVGELSLGVIYVELPSGGAQSVDLLGVFANQATVAVQNMQLYEVAALDPLTGVHARRFIEQWLRREVRNAFRSRKPLSVLLVDVDDMKGINESAGHLVGDQVLATAGRALRSAVRGNDVVGRYGGDEFLILLPETEADRAEKVGWRVLSGLEGHQVPSVDGDRPLRCSFGLSELGPPSKGSSGQRRPIPETYFQRAAQQLIRHATEGLARAQAQGGGGLARGPTTGWSEPPRES